MRVQHEQNRVRTKQLGRNERRQGFTLVEVLMVVVIIGILIGLLVPAVNIAYTGVKRRTIALECQALANAVEQYKNKYGDYPPDGSDSSVMNRHLRKIFPQIASSEITLLTGTGLPSGNTQVANLPAPTTSTAITGAIMDPSEALVFFLGGFSSDPVHPLTGRGGPLYIVNGSGAQINSSSIASAASVQYNIDRTNAFFEFKQSQLTIEVSGGLTRSSEDGLCGGATDLLPAYTPAYGLQAPYAYFESRTYRVPPDSSMGRASAQFNHYNLISSGHGIVAPYRSTEINTKAPLPASPATPTADQVNAHFRWMNEKSFQLLSAGLDDHYGGSVGLFFMFKPQGGSGASSYNSGDSLNLSGVVGGQTRFKDSDNTTFQLDNVANFAEGILEDSLSN